MKDRFYKLAFYVILICFLLFIIEGYIVKYDTEEKGKISIGKYISYDTWGKGEANYFSFNINGIRYKGNGGRAPMGFHKNIGKFYKIRYSEKFKGNLDTFFQEEVTDTTKILNAGFTMNDILTKNPVYARELSFKQEILAILGINE